MKISNKELKQIYINFINQEKVSLKKQCPTVKSLYKVVKFKIKNGKREEIINHISQCQICANEVKFILELIQYEELLSMEVSKIIFDKKDRSLNLSSDLPKKIPFVQNKLKHALTILGIFVIVFVFWETTFNQKKINLRSNEIKLIEILEPKGNIKIQSPIIFKWKTIFPAEYYIFEIFNDDLILVWKSEKTKCCETRLPYQIETKININKSYYWILTAYTKEGIAIETSLIEFRRSK